MTPMQIEAVKNSWSKVTPIADQASVLFYDRLFALDPSLRALFKPDMTEQRKLLMTMLGAAVAGLDRLDTIVPAIQALGRRHKGYGGELWDSRSGASLDARTRARRGFHAGCSRGLDRDLCLSVRHDENGGARRLKR